MSIQKIILASLTILTYIDAKEATLFKEPAMARITSGSYIMGSYYGDKDETPPHKVIIDYDFEIAKYEITVEDFKRFIKSTGYVTDAEKHNSCYTWIDDKWIYTTGVSWKNPNYPQKDTHPAVCISWNDSAQYIKWLNEQTNKNYRLPTEAEWEYVAKAGTYSKWSFGNDKKNLKFYANMADKLSPYTWKEKWNDGYKFTAPVGSYKPNQLNVYDMYGNVWEWCEDWYSKNYRNTPTNGSTNNINNSDKKVFRGASWINFPTSTRSANRFADVPSSRYNVIGFRIARTLKK